MVFYYRGMSGPSAPLPFARARTEAQRDERLTQLAAVTRDLLQRSRATALTLGDIAAAAGLAKSGILRYVGSREALLLRVMYDEHLHWIDALERELPNRTAAAAVASTLAARPVLCDLIAVSPVLLGRLGSDEQRVLASQATDAQQRLGAALQPSLPLSDDQLSALTAAIHAFTGTAWAWATPESASTNPMVTDFESTLGRLVATFIAGLRAEAG